VNKKVVISLSAVLIFAIVARAEAGLRIVLNPWWPRAIVLGPPLFFPPPLPPPPPGQPLPPPPPLEAAGFISLSVVPADADVNVDGKLVGKAREFTQAPGLMSLAPGPHTLALSKEGFKTAKFTVNVIPQKTIELDVTMDALPQGSSEQAQTYQLDLNKTGYLSLKVEPQDASVYVDDTFYGIASRFVLPDSSIVLRAGTHKVEIIRPGYKQHVQIVEVGSDKAQDLNVKLEKN
jgi:hypothetical protein